MPTVTMAMMPHRPLPTRDILAALLVVVIWGSNFVVMKFALQTFTPFQMGAGRYVFAAFPLVLLLRAPPIDWRWLLLYGLLQGLGQFGFLFVALQVGMTAALASVLMQTQVFFTALLSFFLLHERASRALQVGLVLAALGLLCFAMNFVAPTAGQARVTTALGLVLNLMAAAMWALSNIVARHAQQGSQQGAKKIDPLAFVAWSSLVPIVPFALMSALFDEGAARWLEAATWAAVPWPHWAALAFLGWAATSLGYGLWASLLQRYPANRVAPFSLGVPLVGISAGVGLLGERITAWQWAGVLLVLAALLCVLWGQALVQRLALWSAR